MNIRCYFEIFCSVVTWLILWINMKVDKLSNQDHYKLQVTDVHGAQRVNHTLSFGVFHICSATSCLTFIVFREMLSN